MKWTYVVAVGVVAGGLALAVRRRQQKALAEADLWAEATDSVTRFGS